MREPGGVVEKLKDRPMEERIGVRCQRSLRRPNARLPPWRALARCRRTRLRRAGSVNLSSRLHDHELLCRLLSDAFGALEQEPERHLRSAAIDGNAASNVSGCSSELEFN